MIKMGNGKKATSCSKAPGEEELHGIAKKAWESSVAIITD
jgi:hypothetical protein